MECARRQCEFAAHAWCPKILTNDTLAFNTYVLSLALLSFVMNKEDSTTDVLFAL